MSRNLHQDSRYEAKSGDLLLLLLLLVWLVASLTKTADKKYYSEWLSTAFQGQNNTVHCCEEMLNISEKKIRNKLQTCCFIRNTCSSSAFISFSWTSYKEKCRVGIKLALCTVKSILEPFAQSYLSYWRFCNKVFKWIFGFYCWKVFMQYCNFLLIIPSRWTKKKFKKQNILLYSNV